MSLYFKCMHNYVHELVLTGGPGVPAAPGFPCIPIGPAIPLAPVWPSAPGIP